MAVTSAFGFVYWWFAAHHFPPEVVGLASAFISAMLLLGNLCMLGLGTLLIGELPRQPGKEMSLISGALLLVGGVGACIGVIFAIVAPYLSTNFQEMKGGLGDIALFAVGISLTSVTLVLDQALIGLLRGGLQLWRNTLFALVKLGALFLVSLWISKVSGMTIYATWTIGNVISVAFVVALTLPKIGQMRKTYFPQWDLLRRVKVTALQHHLLNLALQAPTLILPVLVIVLLSPTANAWFYVSWTFAGFLFFLNPAITTALYATSSAQPDTLAHRMRLTLVLALVATIVASGVLLLGAKQVLGLFGHTYAEQAGSCLRILSIAGFPLIIKDHYIAVCRVQDRIVAALVLVGTGVILELAMAASGAHLAGLTGLTLGWVIAVCIEAAIMFRTVYKTAWPRDEPRGQIKLDAKNHEEAYSIGARANEPSFGQLTYFRRRK
jgi:O-antigen/teichoic acid export membrane protein